MLLHRLRTPATIAIATALSFLGAFFVKDTSFGVAWNDYANHFADEARHHVLGSAVAYGESMNNFIHTVRVYHFDPHIGSSSFGPSTLDIVSGYHYGTPTVDENLFPDNVISSVSAPSASGGSAWQSGAGEWVAETLKAVYDEAGYLFGLLMKFLSAAVCPIVCLCSKVWSKVVRSTKKVLVRISEGIESAVSWFKFDLPSTSFGHPLHASALTRVHRRLWTIPCALLVAACPILVGRRLGEPAKGRSRLSFSQELAEAIESFWQNTLFLDLSLALLDKAHTVTGKPEIGASSDVTIQTPAVTENDSDKATSPEVQPAMPLIRAHHGADDRDTTEVDQMGKNGASSSATVYVEAIEGAARAASPRGMAGPFNLFVLQGLTVSGNISFGDISRGLGAQEAQAPRQVSIDTNAAAATQPPATASRSGIHGLEDTRTDSRASSAGVPAESTKANDDLTLDSPRSTPSEELLKTPPSPSFESVPPSAEAAAAALETDSKASAPEPEAKDPAPAAEVEEVEEHLEFGAEDKVVLSDDDDEEVEKDLDASWEEIENELAAACAAEEKDGKNNRKEGGKTYGRADEAGGKAGVKADDKSETKAATVSTASSASASSSGDDPNLKPKSKPASGEEPASGDASDSEVESELSEDDREVDIDDEVGSEFGSEFGEDEEGGDSEQDDEGDDDGDDGDKPAAQKSEASVEKLNEVGKEDEGQDDGAASQQVSEDVDIEMEDVSDDAGPAPAAQPAAATTQAVAHEDEDVEMEDVDDDSSPASNSAPAATTTAPNGATSTLAPATSSAKRAAPTPAASSGGASATATSAPGAPPALSAVQVEAAARMASLKGGFQRRAPSTAAPTTAAGAASTSGIANGARAATTPAPGAPAVARVVPQVVGTAKIPVAATRSAAPASASSSALAKPAAAGLAIPRAAGPIKLGLKGPTSSFPPTAPAPATSTPRPPALAPAPTAAASTLAQPSSPPPAFDDVPSKAPAPAPAKQSAAAPATGPIKLGLRSVMASRAPASSTLATASPTAPAAAPALKPAPAAAVPGPAKPSQPTSLRLPIVNKGKGRATPPPPETESEGGDDKDEEGGLEEEKWEDHRLFDVLEDKGHGDPGPASSRFRDDLVAGGSAAAASSKPSEEEDKKEKLGGGEDGGDEESLADYESWPGEGGDKGEDGKWEDEDGWSEEEDDLEDYGESEDGAGDGGEGVDEEEFYNSAPKPAASKVADKGNAAPAPKANDDSKPKDNIKAKSDSKSGSAGAAKADGGVVASDADTTDDFEALLQEPLDEAAEKDEGKENEKVEGKVEAKAKAKAKAKDEVEVEAVGTVKAMAQVQPVAEAEESASHQGDMRPPSPSSPTPSVECSTAWGSDAKDFDMEGEDDDEGDSTPLVAAPAASSSSAAPAPTTTAPVAHSWALPPLQTAGSSAAPQATPQSDAPPPFYAVAEHQPTQSVAPTLAPSTFAQAPSFAPPVPPAGPPFWTPFWSAAAPQPSVSAVEQASEPVAQPYAQLFQLPVAPLQLPLPSAPTAASTHLAPVTFNESQAPQASGSQQPVESTQGGAGMRSTWTASERASFAAEDRQVQEDREQYANYVELEDGSWAEAETPSPSPRNNSAPPAASQSTSAPMPANALGLLSLSTNARASSSTAPPQTQIASAASDAASTWSNMEFGEEEGAEVESSWTGALDEDANEVEEEVANQVSRSAPEVANTPSASGTVDDEETEAALVNAQQDNFNSESTSSTSATPLPDPERPTERWAGMKRKADPLDDELDVSSPASQQMKPSYDCISPSTRIPAEHRSLPEAFRRWHISQGAASLPGDQEGGQEAEFEG
ncbi:hypothetical protein IAT38_003484 [Cryptococcus sp. DSM 104549]